MRLSNYSFFCKKKGSPNFVLPPKRTLQTTHEFQNNLEKNCQACFPSGLPSCSGTACCNSEPSKQTYLDWATAFLRKKCVSAITVFFAKKRALPILFCHQSEPSKQYMSFRIIWKKFATIATLGTNQDPTLETMVSCGFFPEINALAQWI